MVLFDGVCNFCNGMVNFAIRNDRKGKLRFAALQSGAGEEFKKKFQLPANIDSVIVIDKGKIYMHAPAAVRISRYLDWPAKMLSVFAIVPVFISNPVYKWVARHRYKWFGKKDACMVPSAKVRERFLT